VADIVCLSAANSLFVFTESAEAQFGRIILNLKPQSGALFVIEIAGTNIFVSSLRFSFPHSMVSTGFSVTLDF